jgi:hypothetical protein
MWLRPLVAAVLCVSLVSGVTARPSAALAAEKEAIVVSYDKETMKLVVKEGEKERTVQLKKTTHVHYPEGNKIKEVKLAERPDYLKKGVKVVIEEEGGKLVEINIKK